MDINQLISKLDEAVSKNSDEQIVQAVKDVLCDAVSAGFVLPEEYMSSEGDTSNFDDYHRRLVHLDPQKRYSVVSMIWHPHASTQLHDHDEMWCVDCIIKGKIECVQYDLEKTTDDGRYKFNAQPAVQAGPGEAGTLIPPYEYHTLENKTDHDSVSLHVYGGEHAKCKIFVPIDAQEGWYKEEVRDRTLD